MGLHKKQTAIMTSCFARYAMNRDEGVCFNFYYPSSMWDHKWRYEADIIRVDEELHIHEVEVKRTATDFHQEHCKEAKFEMILSGEYYVNYFSYLIPIELYEKLKNKINPLFGIYTINDKMSRITKRRSATLLKDERCDNFTYVSILRQSTINLWRYYEKSNELQSKNKEFKKTNRKS